jgi:hypothetical protein
LEFVFSAIGEAKPTIPVSKVMIVILVVIGESVLRAGRIAPDAGAYSSGLGRSR